MPLSKDTQVALQKKVKVRKEAFGGLVYIPEKMHIFKVNETGRLLLEECREPNTVGALFAKFDPQEFPNLEGRVVEFLEKMLALGAILVKGENHGRTG